MSDAMEAPPRFELGAFDLGGRRSIQLSYGAALVRLTEV